MTPEAALVPCKVCKELIREGALRCRYCGSSLGPPLAREWYRVRAGKKLGGVCMGLAREWGVSVTIVRLAFVIATIFGGWGLPVYLALWLIMPLEPEARPFGDGAPVSMPDERAQPGRPFR